MNHGDFTPGQNPNTHNFSHMPEKWYRVGHFLPLKGIGQVKHDFFSVFNSIENLKINQYLIFQLIVPVCFHFFWYFVNSIIPRGRPLRRKFSLGSIGSSPGTFKESY